MEKNVSDLANKFREILLTDCHDKSGNEIVQISTEITKYRKDFSEKCKALEESLKSIGSIDECRNFKRLRFELLSDAHDTVTELNDIKRQLNLELSSNVDPRYQPSLISIMSHCPSPEVPQNAAAEEANQDPALGDNTSASSVVDHRSSSSPPHQVEVNHPLQPVVPPVDDVAPPVNVADQPHPVSEVSSSTEMNVRMPQASAPPVSQVSAPLVPHNYGSTDSASYLIKAELLKPPVQPFSGDTSEFQMWVNLLKGRMACVTLSHFEQLQILYAHTSGRPKELVSDFLSNVTPETAESSLQTVWSILQERYGSKISSSQRIIDRIRVLPSISSIDDEENISRLLDACRNAMCMMSSTPQLDWLNHYEGIQMVSGKLPDTLSRRWRSYGIRSKNSSGSNPNLSVFVTFLHEIYKESVDDFFKKPTTSKKEVKDNRQQK